MSPPRATRSTMPSSMAQKNARLPSGLTFWIERTNTLPPSVTTTGWVANTRGVSASVGTPTMRAYSTAAGSPLISVTTRRPGSAPVTTSRSELATKCSVLNTRNGAGEWMSASTAQSVRNSPRV